MRLTLWGTGLMGAPMARSWQQAGHQLTVWNRTQAKAEVLLQAGINVASDLSTSLEQAEALILMLSDEPAIQACLHQLPADALQGKTVLQMGTISPRQSLNLQQQMHLAQAEYLEIPVLGSIAQAENRQLIGMAGCTAEQFTRWQGLLQELCATLVHVGPVGQAAALKLALNQMIPSLLAVFGLSLEYIRCSGVPVETFMQILRSSALYAPTYDKKLARLLAGDFQHPNFPVRHMQKDLALFAETAAPMGLNTSTLKAVQALLEQAACQGFADQDYSALCTALTVSAAED